MIRQTHPEHEDKREAEEEDLTTQRPPVKLQGLRGDQADAANDDKHVEQLRAYDGADTDR